MANIEHDLALLHHAYYVGELEVGRRAAARLSAQNLPADVENRARINNTYYIPTLSEIGPVEFRSIDIKPAAEGWSLFNPTLLQHEGALYGLVRSSNYAMEGMVYHIPPSDNGVIRTQSILVAYDDDLRVNYAVVLRDPDYKKTATKVDGLEDCRLYARDGQLCVSATVRNYAPYDGACRIGTAKIDLQSGAFFDLAVRELPRKQHEKNWMPIVGAAQWLYACNSDGKTLLVEAAGDKWRLIDNGPAPLPAKHFRGGSQLVPFFGGYLAVVHEVTFDGSTRIYSHRFVWFDCQLRVCKTSAPFYFRNKRSIEFAAGMASINNQIVLSFGHCDKSAWLAVLSAQHINNLLI